MFAVSLGCSLFEEVVEFALSEVLRFFERGELSLASFDEVSVSFGLDFCLSFDSFEDFLTAFSFSFFEVSFSLHSSFLILGLFSFFSE